MELLIVLIAVLYFAVRAHNKEQADKQAQFEQQVKWDREWAESEARKKEIASWYK
jgi:cbb3-type cytochrome oxidase subunit 3